MKISKSLKIYAYIFIGFLFVNKPFALAELPNNLIIHDKPKKITNIKVLKLKSDQFHDSVIICTANSLVQMSAIIKNIRKNLKIQKFTYEGENSNWLLISAKGVLIQIFTEESREYYNIEDIYFDSETLYHYG